MRSSRSPKVRPRNAPGASGKGSAAASPRGAHAPPASTLCGRAGHAATARCSRPRRRISAVSSGRARNKADSRSISPHSLRVRWRSRPCKSSQRSVDRSPSPCSSASRASQSPFSRTHSAWKSATIWAMASPRDCVGVRSIRRSRCHSIVRRTCSASAGAVRTSSGRPSAATAPRSACTAAGSPKSASRSGSAPACSASRQRARSARRCAVSPLLLVTAGSHSVRGKAASRSYGASGSMRVIRQAARG